MIDVGIANPTDYGLGDVRLSDEVLSEPQHAGRRDRAFVRGRRGASGLWNCTCSTPTGKPQKRIEQTLPRPRRASCGRSSSTSAT